MIFNTQAVKFKDKTLYEFAKISKIEADVHDLYHYVNHPTRLDQLATIYYDNPELWWIIASANDFWGVISIPGGQTIRIPNKNRITSILKMIGEENEY